MSCMVAASEETFESLAELVRDSCGCGTFFDHPEWLRAWWEEICGGGELKLLSVRDGRGEAVLVAPLYVRDGVAAFLGGTDLFDYHDFILPKGAEAFSPAAADELVHHLSGDSSITRLEFTSLPGDSLAAEYLPGTCRAYDWSVSMDREDAAPRLELPGTWEEYLARLSRKNRHELRRKLRRLERAGAIRDYELSESDDIAEGMDDFLVLHRKSNPQKAEFMSSERERFFRRVTVRLASDGISRLSFVEMNGVRIAASLSFVWGGARYLYNSGYDPEFRYLAAGLLNHAYNIRRSIQEGLSIFDFMRGDEPYKYRLGGKDRTLFKLTADR